MLIGIIEIVFIVIFVICALLVIALVLMQDEQGEGLGGIFGGGSATPFGSRSGNVLTRFTAILGTVFLLTALGLSWMKSGGETGDVLGAAAAARQESAAGIDWWKTSEASSESVNTPEAKP